MKYEKEALCMARSSLNMLKSYHKRVTMPGCSCEAECEQCKSLGKCPARIFDDAYLEALDISLSLIEREIDASV